MDKLGKKIFVWEIIFGAIFFNPIVFLSAYTNDYRYLYTYCLGIFISISTTLLLFWSVDWIIKLKKQDKNKNPKRKYFGLYFLLFLIRMLIYIVSFIIIVLFPNIFSVLILFLPFSFRTIAAFIVGSSNRFVKKTPNIFKHKYFELSDIHE